MKLQNVPTEYNHVTLARVLAKRMLLMTSVFVGRPATELVVLATTPSLGITPWLSGRLGIPKPTHFTAGDFPSGDSQSRLAHKTHVLLVTQENSTDLEHQNLARP
jgi:hypothetical protein